MTYRRAKLQHLLFDKVRKACKNRGVFRLHPSPGDVMGVPCECMDPLTAVRVAATGILKGPFGNSVGQLVPRVTGVSPHFDYSNFGRQPKPLHAA